MNEEAPAWLQGLFESQARQISELASQQSNSMAQQANSMAMLADRIAQMEERGLQESTAAPYDARTPAENPSSQDDVRRPKPSLPHTKEFDGTDLALYAQFRGLLEAKLRIDGKSIGGTEEQVWYGFGRLTGTAAKRVYPWITFAQQTNQLTVQKLFEQMDIAFLDPRTKAKAIAKLNKTKQGTVPFLEYLTEFDRLLLEAQGWGWDSEIKKGYLKTALSTKLLTGLIGTEEKDSYEEFCAQLRRISDQQEEVREKLTWRTGYKTREISPRMTPAPVASDQMDWERTTTQIAATHAEEPRWASPEEIERRRRERLCLRCGKSGHMVRDCRTKLIQQEKKVRAAPARKKEKRRVVEVATDTEVSTDSEESGKE